MQYIAVLDYEHLDNGVFLSSLASAISKQQDIRPVIIHGDSAYTERIMQTGVMREQAKVRSIKDLNHRLIALFADQGISAIGINGYQRKFISRTEDSLTLDQSFYNDLPNQSVLLISTLVWDEKTSGPIAIPLERMASFLQSQLDTDSLFAFSRTDRSEILIEDMPEKLQWNSLPSGFAEEHLPEELRSFDNPLHLTTAREFHQPFSSNHGVFID